MGIVSRAAAPAPPRYGSFGQREAAGALRVRPGCVVVEDPVLFHDVFAEVRDATSALRGVELEGRGWRRRRNFERFWTPHGTRIGFRNEVLPTFATSSHVAARRDASGAQPRGTLY